MPTSITLVATSTSASPAANFSIAAAFCFDGICPWISSTRWSANSVVRSRSNSAVAALAWSASDSSTSGHTTKHCRPAAISSRIRSYARARARAPSTTYVSTGRRPRGSSRSTVASRSPYAVSESVRGIGVAVMWSACGTSPSGALRVERRALAHAEAVLLVHHDHRQVAELHRRPRSARACPPPAEAAPLASRSSSSRRRAAVVEPVSSSTGMCPPSSESSVRWCCSASVSVGAMNAAWAPFSTARSMAASAIAVLPEPTSPISSRCIGRSRARSASISPMALTWSPVSSNGSDHRHRSTITPRAASGRAFRPSRRARRRPATASCSRNSSSNASRRRAPCSSSSVSGKCTASSTAGRSGSPSSTRRRAGSGSTSARASGPRLADERAQAAPA